MTTDPLADLLRSADAAPPSEAGSPSAFAQTVGRRVARRRAVRSASAAGVTVALAVALGWSLHLASSQSGSSPPTLVAVQPAPSAVDVARLRREMEAASIAAARQEAMIDQMLAAEARGRRQRGIAIKLSRSDPADRIDTLCDRAALSLVRQGERQRRDLGEPAAAAANYRDVIRLFPGSRWSAVARERLHEMEG